MTVTGMITSLPYDFPLSVMNQRVRQSVKRAFHGSDFCKSAKMFSGVGAKPLLGFWLVACDQFALPSGLALSFFFEVTISSIAMVFLSGKLEIFYFGIINECFP